MSDLERLKEESAKAAGFDRSMMKEGKCVQCKEPFSDSNFFTHLGWKETKISGLCEKCWDAMMGGGE